MEKIKKKLNNKPSFVGIIIHIVILYASLSLGYNSYKGYMRGFDPLSRVVKDAIKFTFPQAILIFSVVYLIFFYKKKIDSIFLTIWRYIFIISIYTILLNLFFLKNGKDILIPLNLSSFYFLILLSVFWFFNKFVNIENLDILKLVFDNLIMFKSYLKERPSANYIILFMILLIVSAFLLITKDVRGAEKFAAFSYFSLLIGVGIDVYLLFKGNERH